MLLDIKVNLLGPTDPQNGILAKEILKYYRKIQYLLWKHLYNPSKRNHKIVYKHEGILTCKGCTSRKRVPGAPSYCCKTWCPHGPGEQSWCLRPMWTPSFATVAWCSRTTFILVVCRKALSILIKNWKWVTL
jgi:hypothetical protein